MFSAVAFIPVAPLLVLGPAEVAGETRSAISRTLAAVGSQALPVHLSVAAPRTSDDGPGLMGFGGGDLGGQPKAPAGSLRSWRVEVAESLLGASGLAAVDVQQLGPGSALVEPESDACLVVAADGSAMRTEAAPGSLDQRAVGFDAAALAAIGAADPAALAGLDTRLGEDLLADAAHVWPAVGVRLGDRSWRPILAAELNDPLGVGYLTGAWAIAETTS